MSKRDGEDYFDFVRRSIESPLARPVKRPTSPTISLRCARWAAMAENLPKAFAFSVKPIRLDRNFGLSLSLRRLDHCPKRKGSPMELQSKVALVTGAGSGIGRASAIKLAEAGAVVGNSGPHARRT